MADALKIYCKEHSRYRGKVPKTGKRSCDACFLLYILRWQGDRENQHRIEGPNIYQFLGSAIDEFGTMLRVRPG